MRGIDSVNLEISQVNAQQNVKIFDSVVLAGKLREPWKYNATTRCLISSLNARVWLPSLAISPIPNIYPEDSAYQRFAKKQQGIKNYYRLQLFIEHPNGTSLNLGIVQLPHYGGYWTENLLLEILQTQRESLAVGDGCALFCRLLDPLAAGDTINIFGVADWELSLLPRDPVLSDPQNFGVLIGGSATLVRPANGDRYRLHIQNVGPDECWWLFGAGAGAIPNQCLFLPPGAAWEEETLRYSTQQAVWAICPSGSAQVVGFEQSLIYG